MRILQIIHDFVPETLAGTEIITHALSATLAAKGHQVFVFCRGWKLEGEPYTVRDEDLDGFQVRRIDFGHIGQQHIFKRHDARMDQALREYIERVRPQIVHVHHMRYLSTNVVAIAKEFGLPVLITLHDFSFRCPVASLLYYDGTVCHRRVGPECLSCVWPHQHSRKRKFLPWKAMNPAIQVLHTLGQGHMLPVSSRPRQALDSFATWTQDYLTAYDLADAVHSPSQFLADMVIDDGVPADKVFVIENGIDYRLGGALPKTSSTALRFGHIGKDETKGTEVAIEAMKLLPYESAELRVYGRMSGAYANRLQKMAQGANVHMMGSFEQEDLARIFSEIDVLIVPSIWYENCPTVIREAYAHNTPVVASRFGGMIEAVRDGIDGFHFEVGSPTDLAAKLQKFIHQPRLVEQLQWHITPPPTSERFAAEIESAYQKLLQQQEQTPTAPKTFITLKKDWMRML